MKNSESYLIGIDVGTSGTKAVLFDLDGNAVRSHSCEYPLFQPRNGWAEQNPEDWWNAAKECLDALLSPGASGTERTENVLGIGLTGQMHGLVMLDEACEVIRPAIIWCDQRTDAECAKMTKIIGKERLIDITANPALPGFTASKILWVKKHEPDNYARCRHILLPKDYIRFKLTGVFATDVSDASGMQLMNIAERCWSDEVLEALGIDRALLPELFESPELTGYYNGIPIAAGAGDNAAAALGTGVAEDGKAFTTIGTSGVVFAHTSEMKRDRAGRIHTFCCAVPGKWHVMGVTQAAGLSYHWFRNNFAKELSYRELDECAARSPIGANRLLFLPYLMGERSPHLDSNARGVFFGLSGIHTTGDLARAVMEGVSYSLKDCLSVIDEAGISVTNMAVCGGGGKSPFWRQMLADLFECPVAVTSSKEGPCLGAAILAGVCAGVYESVEKACSHIVKTTDNMLPIAEHSAAYRKYYPIYQSLYPDLKKDFERLSEADKSDENQP